MNPVLVTGAAVLTLAVLLALVHVPLGTYLHRVFTDEEDWRLERLCGGVWTIFPHVSFAGGLSGGLISQLFPGPTVDTSMTVQSYFVAAEPDDEKRAEAQRVADFLERVVHTEDYPTGLRQQRALATGAKPFVLFGRNELGGQRFHEHLEELISPASPPAGGT